MGDSLAIGYYEFLGNTVLYEGGRTATDIDANEEIPIDLLYYHAEYLGEEI